ncbi:MAG: choline-sulfatase [Planctomycetota bacterium]|jgi:choline-sulfatase
MPRTELELLVSIRPQPWNYVVHCLGMTFLLGCIAGCGSKEARSSSTLLITFDTTRADALGCYGNEHNPSPNLDRLAAEGVLYERAYTPIPLTLPAHSSMLTGLIPARHTVRNNGWPLPESARTLAELARAEGVQTGAFVAAVVLDAHLGIAQGFDQFEAPAERPDANTTHYTERPAREVVDGAIGWLLDRDPERPYFLWVHVFEPHDPMEPDEAFRSGRFKDQPYLGEVATADREVGRLLDMMRSEGLLDETFVMMTGDHGEAFGEHGELSHGIYCYEPTMHVPLIIRNPSDPKAGERSQVLTSTVDVMPTLAAAMGLKVPSQLDGLDLLGSEVSERNGIYVESYWGYLNFGWSPLTGWIDADGKYLHSSDPEFYALPSDAEEAHDLFQERGTDWDPYRQRIQNVLKRPALQASSSQMDADLLARIESLGYAGVGDAGTDLPHAMETVGRVSPKQGAPEHKKLLQAQALMNRGDHSKAAAIFEKVLSSNPSNFMALDNLSFCLMRLDRHSEAIQPLERIVEARPQRTNSFYNLAVCLWSAEQQERAIDTMWIAVRQDPSHPRYGADLIQFLRSESRLDEIVEVERLIETTQAETGQ